jgi:hypothetical protein
MDDGGVIKNGGLYLHTNSYKKEEVEYLIEILKTKFNLSCSIRLKRENQ